MRKNDRDWFLDERSAAWAGLLLTSRADLSARREPGRDGSGEFLVSLRQDGGVATRHFVVHVRGTLSSESNDWSDAVRPLFRAASGFLPECVFVVNVRQNSAQCAWIAEPDTTSGTARLNLQESPKFLPLDETQLEAIVESVRNWYDAIPRERVPQAS